ncbi:MAG TPA: hypothetical protein VHI98_25765 [Vicinamibacterales bacterium]|jgi:hypothetical protein|nr:hypothetical protein [Vicinamibacterales bacterium]
MPRGALALGLAVICVAAAIQTAAAQTPPRTPRSTPAAGSEGWVVLPVDEYRALRSRAFPSAPAPDPLPTDATLTRIDYEIAANGDSVTGRATLTIDVVKQGWTRVATPAGLMVSDARLDGRAVSIVDGAPPHVLLSRPGRSVLTLDIVVPVGSAGGVESIVLPPSPSAVSRVALILPRGGVDLSAAGGFVAERDEAANQTRWIVFGRAQQPLTLSWKRRVDDRRVGQTLRLRGRVAELVTLGEEVSPVLASVRVEVVQGVAREVALALPEGLAVNQVTGPTVADWDAARGSLQVRLLEPSAADVSLTVHGELRTPRDGAIAIPLLRLTAAERETGGVVVDVAGAGEIGDRQPRGLEPTDPSEFSDVVAGRESPSMIAFKFRPIAGSDPRSLTVGVERFTPEAVLVANVEEARYRGIASEDGRLLVEARYAVRNNQRSFLKVTLPADSTLWSAAVADRPVRPGVSGANAVLLPLDKGRSGEEAPTFVVEMLYLQRVASWHDKGLAQIALPALDLPISRTGVALHYSPRFEVEARPGMFREASDPGPFAEALRRISSSLAAGSSAAWSGGRSTEDTDRVALKALVDRYQNESGGRTVVGSLPVRVAFPELGPSLFLAAELTSEGAAPSVDLAFKRTR